MWFIIFPWSLCLNVLLFWYLSAWLSLVDSVNYVTMILAHVLVEYWWPHCLSDEWYFTVGSSFSRPMNKMSWDSVGKVNATSRNECNHTLQKCLHGLILKRFIQNFFVNNSAYDCFEELNFMLNTNAIVKVTAHRF